MTADTVATLARRIDKSDSRQDNHDAICSERYDHLNTTIAEFKGAFADLKGELAKVTETVQTIAQAQVSSTEVRKALAGDRPKWWHPVVVAGVGLVITGMIGLIGWMASTIWNLNNERVDDALHRAVPSASVTVNPATQAAPDTGQTAN